MADTYKWNCWVKKKAYIILVTAKFSSISVTSFCILTVKELLCHNKRIQDFWFFASLIGEKWYHNKVWFMIMLINSYVSFFFCVLFVHIFCPCFYLVVVVSLQFLEYLCTVNCHPFVLYIFFLVYILELFMIFFQHESHSLVQSNIISFIVS